MWLLSSSSPLTHICRLYRQQLDIEKAEQLKRPTEDLEVREATSLFSLPEMGWVRLPSQAFADLLMVTEFGHSFEEFLQLEPSLPLSSIYLSLYNYQEGKVVVELCTQLLKAVVYDPGKELYYTVEPLNKGHIGDNINNLFCHL